MAVKRKLVYIEKQKTRVDKIKDWVIIILSVGSIATFGNYYIMLQNYRQEINDAKKELREESRNLEIKFDTSMAYDAATQSKLSAYIERQPQNKLEIQSCIQEVKAEFVKNLEKRKLTY